MLAGDGLRTVRIELGIQQEEYLCKVNYLLQDCTIGTHSMHKKLQDPNAGRIPEVFWR